MKITKTKDSRLSTTDFTDLPFGRVFSDHMLVCNYRNGAWQDSEILPYGPISMNPGSQVLHYGQSIFEGMKAFKNSNNEVLFFRRDENFKRLNRSAIRMSIPEISNDIFMDGLDKLLALDSEWCKVEEGYSLYIRPFIFASSECIKASSSEEFTFIIITAPTTTYYTGEVNLLIEEHFTRASRGGVGFAKAAGNYAATFYPTKKANAKGFEQVIWTDSNEHKYIEECGTMNIWFRIGDKLITPELSDSILNGITRNSIIALAKDAGIEVEEKKILVSDLIEAYNSRELKEIFGTGTAVSISSITSITFREDKMILPTIKDSFALKLKQKIQGIQKGKIKDVYGWITKVPLKVTIY
jgi:branched-chain amino acid aminotransferase